MWWILFEHLVCISHGTKHKLSGTRFIKFSPLLALTASSWNKHPKYADIQKQFFNREHLQWIFCWYELSLWYTDKKLPTVLHLWPNVLLHHLLVHLQAVIWVVESRTFPSITWSRELCWCTCQTAQKSCDELCIDLFDSCCVHKCVQGNPAVHRASAS